MSSGRHELRLLRYPRAPSCSIWLGDYALSNAILRYARGKPTRRYVAFTPGPLEARKRTARRRMANVGQSAATDVFDPRLLAGIEKQSLKNDWQWQSPTRISAPNEPGEDKKM